MKRTVKIFSLLLCLSFVLSLCGCGLTRAQVMELVAPTHEEEQGQVETVTPTEVVEEEPEVVEYCPGLSFNFNPLTAESDDDWKIIAATCLSLGQLPDAVSGQENDNGSYTVTVELPGNLRYSDGQTVDIDDLLFTLYALLDESYAGPNTLRTLPIVGLQDYYRGVDEKTWQKYSEVFDQVYNEGRYDEDLVKKLKETQVAQPYNDYHETMAQRALDAYDRVKADDIRQALLAVWRDDAEYLVDYCMDNFSATAEYHTHYTVEDIRQNPGLQVMFAMVELSFGTLLDNGTLVGKKTGATWDMKEHFPTADDLFNEMVEIYGGSAETYWAIEGIGRGDILEMARVRAVQKWADEDEDWDDAVVRIPGIVRVGDRMATVSFETFSPDYMAAIAGLYPAPRHIFACEGLYDYANGSYGFPKGSTNKLPTVKGVSVGLGEYTMASCEDGRIVLVHNESGEERILSSKQT